MRFLNRRIVGLVLGLLSAGGCVPKNYLYGKFRDADTKVPANDIVRGTPDKTLDAMTHFVEGQQAIIPIGHAKHSRELSLETAERVSDYLQKNELDDLHIEINHYAPAEQWRRLRENNRISPLWRYTAGAMSVVGYTIFPGRVWGTNSYNPYTDSLYINSNKPLELLQESAIAKEVRSRRWPGPYAVATSLPGIAIIRHAHAAEDVVGYARAEHNWEIEKRAYRELYPHVITQGTGGVGPVVGLALNVAWWVRPIIGLGGSALGRGIGYVMEKRRESELPPAIIPEKEPSTGMVENEK
jgi:hypothetical protein